MIQVKKNVLEWLFFPKIISLLHLKKNVCLSFLFSCRDAYLFYLFLFTFFSIKELRAQSRSLNTVYTVTVYTVHSIIAYVIIICHDYEKEMVAVLLSIDSGNVCYRVPVHLFNFLSPCVTTVSMCLSISVCV